MKIYIGQLKLSYIYIYILTNVKLSIYKVYIYDKNIIYKKVNIYIKYYNIIHIYYKKYICITNVFFTLVNIYIYI